MTTGWEPKKKTMGLIRLIHHHPIKYSNMESHFLSEDVLQINSFYLWPRLITEDLPHVSLLIKSISSFLCLLHLLSWSVWSWAGSSDSCNQRYIGWQQVGLFVVIEGGHLHLITVIKLTNKLDNVFNVWDLGKTNAVDSETRTKAPVHYGFPEYDQSEVLKHSSTVYSSRNKWIIYYNIGRRDVFLCGMCMHLTLEVQLNNSADDDVDDATWLIRSCINVGTIFFLPNCSLQMEISIYSWTRGSGQSWM